MFALESPEPVSNVVHGSAGAVYQTGVVHGDLHLHAAPPPPAPEGLHAYLTAALRAAEKHPYLVLDQDEPPALSKVYVRQLSQSTGDETAEPVETVLARADQVCALIAGPGGGKSTALRMRLRDAAADQLEGTGHAVPVWVSARALVDEETPLAEALAAATRKLSRYGPHPELSAARFRESPWPGACWQLLVDDLDELPNPEQRRAVLEKVANAVEQEPELYRCVVATRPLRRQELTVLGAQTPHYELQPFTSDDQRVYFERYFAARWDQEEAARRAGLFLRALETASLSALAGTPLMAYMLGQLYLAAPERPLPAGRTAVYEAFTDLVYENNRHKRIADSHEELITQLVEGVQSPRARAATESAARRLHDVLPDLVNRLAHHWRTTPSDTVTEALAGHPAVHRPDKIGSGRWEVFLEDLLALTGLLVRRPDGLGFTHQTFVEYHAAVHATRDKATRARVLNELIPAGKAEVTSGVYPSPEASYLGFLLDQLLAAEDTAGPARRRLANVAERGSIRTIHFLVMQATYLRTTIPPEPLIQRLTLLIEHPSIYDPIDTPVYAASWLSLFDGHRESSGAVLLRFVEDDSNRIWDRIEAAGHLAELDEHAETAAQWLHVFVSAALLEIDERVLAAQQLARTQNHQDCGVGWLTRFAQADRARPTDRIRAARSLATVPTEIPSAEALLTAFAAEFADDDDRVAAAWYLATIEEREHEGGVLLVRFVEDPAVQDSARMWAAWGLAQLDEFAQIGTTWLKRFAADPRTRKEARKRMAEVAPKKRVFGGRSRATPPDA